MVANYVQVLDSFGKLSAHFSGWTAMFKKLSGTEDVSYSWVHNEL
jgi:hypothetical protein